MLSGAMLFDFLGHRAAGDTVRNAVKDVLDSDVGTPDLGLPQKVGTAAFASHVAAAMTD